ncbi:unnamed protein product [Chondrus crispus]|uniref:BACK domain-containing protein n=1 Tax=Chondrus crispus TaxID=2769 RepID=R7QF12_CHOCR|nr:unnamed protein product [Chondrus crispus]CDF36026.1 unnamed protein product [Chondrus crispus]|eukprot:XP_005715845.1 unnamed protein product [Chondrus crispus]
MDPVQLKCRKVVKDNFAVVSRHPEFLNVCPASVARVLRIHDLIVQSEDDVFQALERWLAFDVDARAEHALHLLRLVRLPTISDRVLLRVCRSPYFGGHNEFYQLLLEALIRRTEVRIVHAPRIKEIAANVAAAPSSSAPVKKLKFTPIGVTDTELLPTAKVKLTEWPPPVRRAEEKGVEEGATMVPRVGKPDEDEEEEGEEEEEEQIRKRKEIERQQQQNIEFNKRQNRTVLFEGLFPLRWYKSVRFRPRSAYSLLFTVVIPKWSSCRRRFISESRSFLNHKWSLWVDPFSADPSRASRDHAMSASQHGSPSRVRHQTQLDRDHDPLYVGNTLESSPSGPSTSRAPPRPTFDENDYISIYLCCESELGGSHTVDARVDFGLFVVSTSEEYGMERKVCVGRTFKSHGQAMGFRRHIRRSRLHSAEAALYNRDKDELVVGAHLVAPDVERPDLGTGSFSQLSRASITADDFRSEGPLSPSSDHLEGSRMTTMETEQSPILTSASRVS